MLIDLLISMIHEENAEVEMRLKIPANTDLMSYDLKNANKIPNMTVKKILDNFKRILFLYLIQHKNISHEYDNKPNHFPSLYLTNLPSNDYIVIGEKMKSLIIAFIFMLISMLMCSPGKKIEARNTAITEVGGINWNLIDEGVQPDGYRCYVAYLPNTSGKTFLAVGITGTDVSLDSGRTWAQIDTVGYHSIGFANSDADSWAVGADGRIAKLLTIKAKKAS